MPKLVWKEVLRPGSYFVKDRFHTFTDGDLSRFARVGREMIGARLQIPQPLEHQPDAEPTTEEQRRKFAANQAADFARNNTGFVHDWQTTRDGALWARLSIEDAEIARKAPASIKFCSPRIRKRFADATGKVWDNCITHLALTPQPVFHDQKPFGAPVPAELSLSAAPQLHRWAKQKDRPDIELSLFNAVQQAGKAWQTIDLSKGEMPEELKDEEETGDEEPDDETPPPEEKDDAYGPENESADEQELQGVLKYLAKDGIHLPPDTNTKNFVERLRIACHAKQGAAAAQSPPNGEAKIPPNGPTPEMMAGAKEEPQMVAMSQLQEENKRLKTEVCKSRQAAFLADIATCKAKGWPANDIDQWTAAATNVAARYG